MRKLVFSKNPLVRQLVFLSVLLVILILGYVHAYNSDPETEKQLERVVNVWSKIHNDSFTEKENQQLIQAGIRGMLQTLDPHTHFLDEETYRYMRQEQEGGFYGIGISFDIRDGVLTVVSPIEDTPAWKAGIRAGDRIVKINGKPTTGITTSEVINTLRGKQGSSVVITIQRESSDEMRDVTLVRDKIPMKSARLPLMLNDTTGYIRLNNFATTTNDELAKARAELKEKGAKQLILDLRFNSGGLLTAAQEVAQQFLKPGQPIVLTRGRVPGSNMEIKAENPDSDTTTPLIVLVNEYSASASEIVAGAVQDHDRGLVLGEVTFGKGLVGSLYPLSQETALQITTAQYYTASGRYIQKPYDIPHRKSLSGEDQPLFKGAQKEGEKTIYFTDLGRKVYGGGGISPDVTVEEPKLSDLMRKIESYFFDYAVQYMDAHSGVNESVEVTDTMIDEFKQLLASKKVTYNEEQFSKEITDIRNEIKHQIISVAVNVDQGYLFSLSYNPMVQKAIELFPKLPELISQGIKPEQKTTKS